MSPVSRGRKPKKSAKRTKKAPAGRPPTPPADPLPSALSPLGRALGARERPEWFDPAIARALDGAAALDSASGPRELEQLVAELVGAELHRAVLDETRGLWLEWWFTELLDATVRRAKDEPSVSTVWLLHGLAALATPAHQPAPGVLRRAAKVLSRDGTAIPEWLAEVPRIAATGEVLRMCDAYGSRFAVIADFAWQRTPDRSVYLFDVDASGFVTLATAGVFSDVEQAAAAWRAGVGDTAEHARPEPVEDIDQLRCLVECDPGDERAIMGDESRAVLDNWMRAQRRIHELDAALRKRGTPLPTPESLYHDIDVSVMTEPFSAWHTARHGGEPDPEAVEALAVEWMEGALPETWFAAAPGRVTFQLDLIGDWVSDHPIRRAVTALMPEWVRWLTERAGLPEHLRRRSIEPAGTAATPLP